MKTGIPRPLAHHPHMEHEAAGLASLGRGNDSMLVHMTPGEVGGLQKLAMAHGGSLTVNPHTGLPEAGFLSSLLPMIGGAVLGDAFGLSGTDLALASAGVGVLDKMATGGSWQNAIQAGLQFYGGASLGSALNAINTPAAEAAAAAANTPAPAVSTTPISSEIKGLMNYPEATQQDVLNTLDNKIQSTSVLPEEVTQQQQAAAQAVSQAYQNPNPYVAQPQTFTQQLTSNPGQALKNLYTTMGTQEGSFGRNLGLMGLSSGIGNALQGIGSSSSSNIPQNVPAAYYVPAAGYTSLWNQGTINPNFLKYGYLPPGQAMWLGQGQNPGTYSQTNPYSPGGAFYTAPTSATTQPGVAGKATTNTPLGMKEGGLASLRHFADGGSTEPPPPPPPMPPEQQAAISQQALEQQAAMQHPAMPTNSFNQAAQADPTAAATFLNALNTPSNQWTPPPSPDAMNAYLANMSGPGNPVTGVTGQGGYTAASSSTNTPASSSGDSVAANTQGSITATPSISTPTDAGNTAGTAGSGTSYGGNVYGASDPTAGATNAMTYGNTPDGSIDGFSLQGSLSGLNSSGTPATNPITSGLTSLIPGYGTALQNYPTATAVGTQLALNAINPVLGLTNTVANLGTKAYNYLTGANAPQTQYASTPEEIASKNAEIQAGLDKQSQDMLDNYIQNNVPPEYDLNGQPINSPAQQPNNVPSDPSRVSLTPASQQQIAGNILDTMTSNYDISPSDYISSGSNVSIMGNETTGDNPFGESSNGRNIYDPNTGQWIPTKATRGMPTEMAGGGLAHGGLGSLPEATYAAGGKLLRGPGDGMSDSIPAVIHGSKPQRAALADGEFVIPADVVSHLGNGSTEAGSRKLYEMMDKIRHARTGRKQQAPAVKADKYLPA